MSEEKQWDIYIEGQATQVSEDVYRICNHYERKEEYFSRDLKSERFQRITNTFLPSREDSYDRLQGQGRLPMRVNRWRKSVWMSELFCHLTGEERRTIEPEEIVRSGKMDFGTNSSAWQLVHVILEKYNGQRSGRKLPYCFKDRGIKTGRTINDCGRWGQL